MQNLSTDIITSNLSTDIITSNLSTDIITSNLSTDIITSNLSTDIITSNLTELPKDIINYEILKYLDLKDTLQFSCCNKKIKTIIENNKHQFNIINTSSRKTEDIIKEIEKQHKMDTDNYTYFISTHNNTVFFVYIPNILKKRFIDSKIIILPSKL
ncbi:hypothetical protein CPAV1605_1107 [seawater metagenome]|uniref:F-box domain-containing protein n=1 Tax=seawater metagenome TaxID=1561972 RepID=A0A5E8CJK2_9ZZZZ